MGHYSLKTHWLFTEALRSLGHCNGYLMAKIVLFISFFLDRISLLRANLMTSYLRTEPCDIFQHFRPDFFFGKGNYSRMLKSFSSSQYRTWNFWFLGWLWNSFDVTPILRVNVSNMVPKIRKLMWGFDFKCRYLK